MQQFNSVLNNKSSKIVTFCNLLVAAILQMTNKFTQIWTLLILTNNGINKNTIAESTNNLQNNYF